MYRRFASYIVLCLLVFTCVAFPATLNAAVQFSARQDIATGFKRLAGVAVADFNGDGKSDVAVTDLYDTRVVVYLSDGKGGFSSPISTVLPIANTTGQLVAGDFNEDGKQDLIVSRVW